MEYLQNHKKKKSAILIISALLLILTVGVSGQNPDEDFAAFMDSISNDFESTSTQQKEEFEDFVDQINAEFSNLIRQADEEFARLIQEEWQSVEIDSGHFYHNMDEPKSTKVFDPTEVYRPNSETLNLQETGTKISQDILKEKAYLSSLPKENSDSQTRQVYVNYYGNEVTLVIDTRLFETVNASSLPELAGETWKLFSGTNYNSLIYQLQEIKESLGLNDWGYLKLIEATGEACFSRKKNQVSLFVWFFMNKSGYNLKIAEKNKSLEWLMPTNQQIYNHPYVSISGTKYYLQSGNSTTVRVIPQAYPFAKKNIDLSLQTPLNFREDLVSRALTGLQGQKFRELTIEINQNLIDFYNDYPQTELQVYVNAPLSMAFMQFLERNLRPVINTEDTTQSINMLVEFVQNISYYQSDSIQFGREKFFFPEDMFFYPFADCEDHVILLAALIKHFFSLEVISLNNAGHVIIGIPAIASAKGKKLTINAKNYTLLDPTYLNAPPGIISPNFDLNNASYSLLSAQTTKESARERLTSVLNSEMNGSVEIQSIVSNSNQVKFVTGNYAIGKSQNGFVASFTSGDKLIWLDRITADSLSEGLAITPDSAQGCFVLGKFAGQRQFEDSLENSFNEENYLLIHYDSTGRISWYNALPILHEKEKDLAAIRGRINNSGKLEFLLPSKRTDWKSDYVLETEGENVYFEIIPSNIYAIDIDTLSLAEGEVFNIVNWLVNENARLIKTKYHPATSGIYAVLNLLVTSEVTVTGNIIGTMLSNTNPVLVESRPGLISTLQKIAKIEYENPELHVNTDNKTSVNLGLIEIINGSTLLIHEYTDQTKITVDSGLHFNEANAKYKINFLLINKTSGEILYDYDKHYRKRLSVRQDVIL